MKKDFNNIVSKHNDLIEEHNNTVSFLTKFKNIVISDIKDLKTLNISYLLILILIFIFISIFYILLISYLCLKIYISHKYKYYLINNKILEFLFLSKRALKILKSDKQVKNINV